MIRRLVAVSAAAAVLAVAGCGGDDPPPAKVKVASAFFPLQEVATRIGGDQIASTDLTPLGGQPHDLVPSAPALAALQRAKVVLFLGGSFQPAVEEAITKLPAKTTKVDMAADATLPATKRVPGTRGPIEGAGTGNGADPHAWLDPERFVAMTQQAQAALIAADPANRGAYEQRGGAYVAELTKLASDYKRQLAGCRNDVILTTHPAWGYLAQRYDLEQAVAAGITPGAALDPRSLLALGEYADRRNATTLFTTVPLPARQARVIKRETGLDVKVLNPVEGLTQQERDAKAGYASIMRANLATLVSALDCAAATEPRSTTPGTTPPGTTPAATTPLAPQ